MKKILSNMSFRFRTHLDYFRMDECVVFKKITWQDLSIFTNIILSSLTWCLTLVSAFPLLIAETVSDQAALYRVEQMFLYDPMTQGPRQLPAEDWHHSETSALWMESPFLWSLRSGWRKLHKSANNKSQHHLTQFRSHGCKHSQGFNRINFVFFISWWYQVLNDVILYGCCEALDFITIIGGGFSQHRAVSIELFGFHR